MRVSAVSGQGLGVTSETWEEPALRILRENWGGSTSIEAAEPLGGSDRSNVRRIIIGNGERGAPDTAVAKQAGPHGDVVYDPDSKTGPSYGLFNDWAGIAFLDELEPGPWPRFYGGDRPTGVIVLEDLGAAVQIDHVLLGEDAELAESAMIAFVRTLAELHCLTGAHTDRYDQIRR